MQEEGFVFCADEEFGIEDITKQPDKKDDTAPHLIALSEETTSLGIILLFLIFLNLAQKLFIFCPVIGGKI